MPQIEDNTMNDYLFERFREDKIEKDIHYLMLLNKESNKKEQGYMIKNGINSGRNQAIGLDVLSCDKCPFFEGWTDPLGFPVVRCKLSDVMLQGCSAVELYRNIHDLHRPITITVTSEPR